MRRPLSVHVLACHWVHDRLLQQSAAGGLLLQHLRRAGCAQRRGGFSARVQLGAQLIRLRLAHIRGPGGLQELERIA
jgi:hypothetical protein